MRAKVFILTCLLFVCFYPTSNSGYRSDFISNSASGVPGSLCNTNEKVVFSCPLKRSTKIVSLCSSQLSKTGGYLQYRFGVPGKVELEFPAKRTESQRVFKYSHYFRALVDSTEISFSQNGYTYTVFDEYNGEEKPVISEQGLTVTADSTKRDVKYMCRVKAKADYSDLSEVFENSAPED